MRHPNATPLRLSHHVDQRAHPTGSSLRGVTTHVTTPTVDTTHTRSTPNRCAVPITTPRHALTTPRHGPTGVTTTTHPESTPQRSPQLPRPTVPASMVEWVTASTTLPEARTPAGTHQSPQPPHPTTPASRANNQGGNTKRCTRPHRVTRECGDTRKAPTPTATPVWGHKKAPPTRKPVEGA